MKTESLWNGRFSLRQTESVFPLTTDTFALADFIALKKGDRIWDLGCGSGALALLLAGLDIPFSYTGVDISAEACTLAEKNLTANGIAGKLHFGDIAEISAGTSAGEADLVISNPPYYPPEVGKVGTLARTGCSLEDLCGAASHLLGYGGRFALVYPAQRLPALFAAMQAYGLEPKRLRLLAHRQDKPPKLVLVEGRKGGRPGLTLLPQGVLFQADGTPTDYDRRIYHMIQ